MGTSLTEVPKSTECHANVVSSHSLLLVKMTDGSMKATWGRDDQEGHVLQERNPAALLSCKNNLLVPLILTHTAPRSWTLAVVGEAGPSRLGWRVSQSHGQWAEHRP